MRIRQVPRDGGRPPSDQAVRDALAAGREVRRLLGDDLANVTPEVVDQALTAMRNIPEPREERGERVPRLERLLAEGAPLIREMERRAGTGSDDAE